MRSLILFLVFFLVNCDDDYPVFPVIDGDIQEDSDLGFDSDFDDQIDADDEICQEDCASIENATVVLGPYNTIKIRLEIDNPDKFCPFIEIIFIDETDVEIPLITGLRVPLTPAWVDYDEFYYRIVLVIPEGATGIKFMSGDQELSRARWTEQRLVERGESCDPVGFQNVCVEPNDVCSFDYQGCEPREGVAQRMCGVNLPEIYSSEIRMEWRRAVIGSFYSFFESIDEWGGGSEIVLKLIIENYGDYRISTVNHDTPVWEDTVLYIRRECDEPNTEIAFNDDTGDDWRSTIELTHLRPGYYYIFIDTVIQTSGAFVSLDVSEF